VLSKRSKGIKNAQRIPSVLIRLIIFSCFFMLDCDVRFTSWDSSVWDSIHDHRNVQINLYWPRSSKQSKIIYHDSFRKNNIDAILVNTFTSYFLKPLPKFSISSNDYITLCLHLYYIQLVSFDFLYQYWIR